MKSISPCCDWCTWDILLGPFNTAARDWCCISDGLENAIKAVVIADNLIAIGADCTAVNIGHKNVKYTAGVSSGSNPALICMQFAFKLTPIVSSVQAPYCPNRIIH